MRYTIIGDEDTVLGFGIVGVAGRVVANADEALKAFQDTIKDKEVAIVIMTERTADMIRSIVNEYVFKVSFPLIVEIPDRHGPKKSGIGIREMVNAAIGIKI